MGQIEFPKLFAVDVDKMESVRTDEGHIWGWEKWLVNDVELNVCCKFLIIYPGFCSSKHSHKTKAEYFQILSGKLKLVVFKQSDPEIIDRIIHMESGKQYFIPANTYHRFETETREFVLLLEVSTFEDENTDKLEKAKELY